RLARSGDPQGGRGPGGAGATGCPQRGPRRGGRQAAELSELGIDSPPGHPEITRIVAPNPGPMTLEGTNTYVVGSGAVYVIDPGPADRRHVDAVLAATEGRGEIEGVLLTHSHADHSAAVAMLGAP